MGTVVNRVEIDKETHYWQTKVDMTLSNGVEWGCGFNVRDDGWKLWIYRDTDKGPRLVDYISFGTESERKPDRDSALEALTKWAHEHYED